MLQVSRSRFSRVGVTEPSQSLDPSSEITYLHLLTRLPQWHSIKNLAFLSCVWGLVITMIVSFYYGFILMLLSSYVLTPAGGDITKTISGLESDVKQRRWWHSFQHYKRNPHFHCLHDNSARIRMRLLGVSRVKFYRQSGFKDVSGINDSYGFPS